MTLLGHHLETRWHLEMHEGRKIVPGATLHGVNYSGLQLLGRNRLAICCTWHISTNSSSATVDRVAVVTHRSWGCPERSCYLSASCKPFHHSHNYPVMPKVFSLQGYNVVALLTRHKTRHTAQCDDHQSKLLAARKQRCVPSRLVC